MKKLYSIAIFAISAFVAACAGGGNTNVAVKPASSPIVVNANLHQDDGHDAPRISLADAKKDFDEKEAVFIDTHPANQFELEHIPGAINIQANTIKQNLDKVPKGKKIIAYCS